MPNNPSNPPNGTYTSTCEADYSSWDGTFTYNNGAIEYTLTSDPQNPLSATNKSNGNAIVFDLTLNGETVQFNGSSFSWQPGDTKAKYSGKCHTQGPVANLDGWTASQTS